MKIIDTVATQTASKVKDKKRANEGGTGFGELLGATDETAATSAPIATGGITIPGMLDLQFDTPDPTEQQILHSEELLGELEQLRLMLLSGEVDANMAQRMMYKLKENEKDVLIADELRDIVDEIELRAAVEIAKIEQSRL